MIKNLGYKLAILGCTASCLVSAAQANVGMDSDTGEDDDVVFINDDETSPSVACDPTGTPVNRVVTYTLQNTEPAALRLFNVKLETFADDDSGVGFSFDSTSVTTPTNCITSVSPGTNYGQGKISAFGQCTLIVELTPPACKTTGYNNQPVPTAATFHQLLSIGIGSQEGQLTKELFGEVNVIGTGSQFAVLGLQQDPVNVISVTDPGTGGSSQLFGDLGVLDDAVGFILPNYADVYDSVLDPNVVGAEADFESAYYTLSANLYGTTTTPYNVTAPLNCTYDNAFDDGDIITSGSYCLTSAVMIDGSPVYQDIILTENVTLSGAGNFYFYADPVQHCTGDDAGPRLDADAKADVPRMCNFIVESTFNITYAADDQGNKPSPANVFWILLGNPTGTFANTGEALPGSLGSFDLSHIYLANGSRLDGTVLGGLGDGPGIFGNNITAEVEFGDRAANVNGSLWSRFGLISLSGTTVQPSR